MADVRSLMSWAATGRADRPEEEPYFTIPILHYFSQLFEMPGNPPILLCELLNSCLLHPPNR